jgi:hypothetical protein
MHTPFIYITLATVQAETYSHFNITVPKTTVKRQSGKLQNVQFTLILSPVHFNPIYFPNVTTFTIYPVVPFPTIPNLHNLMQFFISNAEPNKEMLQ